MDNVFIFIDLRFDLSKLRDKIYAPPLIILGIGEQVSVSHLVSFSRIGQPSSFPLVFLWPAFTLLITFLALLWIFCIALAVQRLEMCSQLSRFRTWCEEKVRMWFFLNRMLELYFFNIFIGVYLLYNGSTQKLLTFFLTLKSGACKYLSILSVLSKCSFPRLGSQLLQSTLGGSSPSPWNNWWEPSTRPSTQLFNLTF